MAATNLDDERSVRIFCALHKPYPVPSKEEVDWFDEVRVGDYSGDSSSQSGYILTDKQYLDNISDLNPSFCELTMHYMVYKNIQADFYGFYHYRRYLSFINNDCINRCKSLKDKAELISYLTSPQQYKKLNAILDIYNVVLPRKLYPGRHYYFFSSSIGADYISKHRSEPWYHFMAMIAAHYSINLRVVERYFTRQHGLFIGNIFIMKSELFRAYMTDLMAILLQVYNLFGMQYDTYENRYPGFLAERFLGFWIDLHSIRYKEVDLVNLD